MESLRFRQMRTLQSSFTSIVLSGSRLLHLYLIATIRQRSVRCGSSSSTKLWELIKSALRFTRNGLDSFSPHMGIGRNSLLWKETERTAKGWLQKMSSGLVGTENVSALSLEGLGSRFGPSMLLGKKLNIS